MMGVPPVIIHILIGFFFPWNRALPFRVRAASRVSNFAAAAFGFACRPPWEKMSAGISQKYPKKYPKNMVRAPAGALYCLRFSKCISSHLIHKIVENTWFWTLIIKNCWHAHVQKRGSARSKMSAFIRIHCVSPCICRPRRKSLEFHFFFYFPCRLSLQSLPRLLKTWPSLKRRHCPRQRTWRYHTHPTPPQPHPTCRRVSNLASVAVHVCRKCTWT